MMSLASSFLSQFIASGHRLPRQSWEQFDGWLRESPQIHVERLAAAVVALQLLQFVLYHARFRASHWSVRWGAWAAFYLPVPLAALGVAVMMMRSPCPFWLVAIFFAAGQADTMSAYSLRDADMRSLRRFAKRALTLAYVALALFRCGDGATPYYYQLLRPKEMISLVMGFHVVRRGLKISGRAMIPPSEICKVAADHVRFRQARLSSAAGDYDYNRPPLEAADQPSVVAVGSLESYQSAVSGCTTLEDIDCRLGLRRPSRLLRDARLSSSLFLHLLQRYDGHGAGAPPIQRWSANHAFRDDVAAAGDRGWERAFKLVELQLRFMHDYFFSAVQGSPSSSAYRLYRDYAVFKIGFLLSVLGLVAVPEQELDATCAVCLCLPLILLELCQLLGQPNSIWIVISHICEKKKDLGDMVEMGRGVAADVLEAKLELVLEQLGWRVELLPQYSLVEDVDRSSLRKRFPMGSEEWSPSQFDQLKRWIFEKAVAGSAATGRFAFDGHWPFMRARAPADAAALQWALSQETTIHTILVWHIATWFCDYMSEHTMQANVRRHRRRGAGTTKPFPPPELAFATMLSRYCAYLVAFRPELLGEHRALTASVFRGAVKEAELEFRGLSSPWERHAKMTALQSQQQAASPGGDDAAGSILKQGVRLGGQLMARCRGGSDDGWEVMADFWGEVMLHLARSGGGDAAAHVERLADGGEFVTQLWALLSNGCWWEGHSSTTVATGSGNMHFKLRAQAQ